MVVGHLFLSYEHLLTAVDHKVSTLHTVNSVPAAQSTIGRLYLSGQLISQKKFVDQSLHDK